MLVENWLRCQRGRRSRSAYTSRFLGFSWVDYVLRLQALPILPLLCAALDLPEAGETGPATSVGPRVPFLFYAFELGQFEPKVKAKHDRRASITTADHWRRDP